MEGQKHMRHLRMISIWPKSFKHSHLNMQLNWGDKTKIVHSQRTFWFRYENNLLLKRNIFQGMKT